MKEEKLRDDSLMIDNVFKKLTYIWCQTCQSLEGSRKRLI